LGVVSFSIFESKTENLIQWLPIQSYWQAKNLTNARRYGLSGSLLKKSKTFLTRVSFSFTHSHWGDDKKPLRYSPKEVANLYIEKKIVDFTLSLNTHYTGEMISMYSYPNNNIIPENIVTSIHTSKKYKFQKIESILTLSILNIFNKQYESSKGYPEPGRTLDFKITLKQKRV
jgi:outer membrane cobalamin receptor